MIEENVSKRTEQAGKYRGSHEKTVSNSAGRKYAAIDFKKENQLLPLSSIV